MMTTSTPSTISQQRSRHQPTLTVFARPSHSRRTAIHLSLANGLYLQTMAASMMKTLLHQILRSLSTGNTGLLKCVPMRRTLLAGSSGHGRPLAAESALTHAGTTDMPSNRAISVVLMKPTTSRYPMKAVRAWVLDALLLSAWIDAEMYSMYTTKEERMSKTGRYTIFSLHILTQSSKTQIRVCTMHTNVISVDICRCNATRAV
jgi:hypothetical protein